MNEILLTSIKGIDLEIKRRNHRLECRKFWYEDPFRDEHYNWSGYYLEGYRVMKEIQKLKQIQFELKINYLLCFGIHIHNYSIAILPSDKGLVYHNIEELFKFVRRKFEMNDNKRSQCASR